MSEQSKFIENLGSAFDQNFSVSSYSHFNNYMNLPIKLDQFSIIEQRDHFLNYRYSSGGSCKAGAKEAFIAGSCEYLERYSLRHPLVPLAPQPLSKVNDKRNYLSIETLKQLQGFNAMQFHIANLYLDQINEETPFTWVEATELLTNKKVKVPQEFVVMVRNKYFEVTTSGCAIGSTVESATINGLYELLERHLVMTFWWKKVPPVYFDLEPILKTHLPHIKQAYGPWTRQVRLASIPNSLGLSFFMTYFWGENKKGQPSFVMSAACHLDPLKAIERSLCELGGMLNYKISHIQKLISEPTLKTHNFDLDVTSFENHQNLYNLDVAKDFLFFKNPAQTGSAAIDLYAFDKNDELEILKEKVKAAGFSPMFIEMTPRDVKSLNLHTVRVFDPKAVEINSRHCCRRWGKKELFDSKIKSILDLNQYPHPFP